MPIGRRQHDEPSVTGSTERSGQDHGESERDLKDGDDAEEHRSELNDSLVVGKGAEQHVGKEKEQHAH